MVSTKALAAIALTLIIAMPVGIGFLTAVHQEETDSWQTTTSSKISDLMLNAQTPYYGSYKGSTNNSTLVGDGTATPDYVTLTSAFTSLPVYTDTATRINNSGTSNTYTAYGNMSLMPVSGTVPDRPTDTFINQDIELGTHDAYHFDSGSITLHIGNEVINTTSRLAGIYVYRESATTWAVEYSVSGGESRNYSGVTWFSVNNWYELIGQTHRIDNPHVYYDDFIDLSSYVPSSIVASHSVLKLNDTYIHGNMNVNLSSNKVTVNGTDYTFDSSTDSISIASASDSPGVNVIVSTITGSYADPADGWAVPTPEIEFQWMNSQENEAVTFYVKADTAAGQTAKIGNLILESYDGQIRAHLESYDGTPTTLGAYTYLQVVMSTDGYTVRGLSAWPAMGTVPTIFNSISIDDPTDTFYTVSIEADSQNWHFRVDNANIYSGTYPSTYDYTLNLQQIYPDTNIDIYLNSIGIYGDYINFGGAQLTVDNGSISINGKTYRLLHAHLSAWNEGSHYSLRINGDEVATTSEPPTIFWGGEWSVTATAYKIEQVHEYVTVWHAGEFGLDKTGFAVAGLLACGALLVVLGLSGQRSGGKMGVLLLICGGAAIVFLLII